MRGTFRELANPGARFLTTYPSYPLIPGAMHGAGGRHVISALAPTGLEKPLKRSDAMKETLAKEFPTQPGLSRRLCAVSGRSRDLIGSGGVALARDVRPRIPAGAGSHLRPQYFAEHP